MLLHSSIVHVIFQNHLAIQLIVVRVQKHTPVLVHILMELHTQVEFHIQVVVHIPVVAMRIPAGHPVGLMSKRGDWTVVV
jgi:hypothetical protein